jgi:hypothetical protein
VGCDQQRIQPQASASVGRAPGLHSDVTGPAPLRSSLSMKICCALLAMILLAAISGCGPNCRLSENRTPAEQELLGVWSASDAPVRERAAAVERCFTNGTPIPFVVAVLGTNCSVLRPFSSVWVGPGPEPRKTCSLLYYFGPDIVTIGTSADIGGDPFSGEFTGAGYSFPVTPLTQTSNRTTNGQP